MSTGFRRVLVCALLLAPSGACAPRTPALAPPQIDHDAPPVAVVVTGRVEERGTRAPLEGAEVAVVGTMDGAVTDTAGVFRFRAELRPGTYTVLVRFIGHAVERRRLRVRRAGEIRLEPVRLERVPTQLSH